MANVQCRNSTCSHRSWFKLLRYWPCLAALLTSSAFYSQHCIAEATFAAPVFPSHFWSKTARNTDINLLSPRQMSDEQLMLSAATIRAENTTQAQRLLNNLWLTMEQSKHYEGAKALGQLLSLGYFSYRRALTREEFHNPFFTMLGSLTDDALITHFKHYDIEVSSRALVFSLHVNI